MSLPPLSRQPEFNTSAVATSWLGSGIRWFFCALFIIIGIWFTTTYFRYGLLAMFGWVAFGMLWVPASFYLSKKIQNVITSRVRTSDALDSRKPLSLKPRCPNCKSEVTADQTLCHHCYEDLLSNCQDCGKVIKAPHKVCRECAKKHKDRKLRIKRFS